MTYPTFRRRVAPASISADPSSDRAQRRIVGTEPTPSSFRGSRRTPRRARQRPPENPRAGAGDRAENLEEAKKKLAEGEITAAGTHGWWCHQSGWVCRSARRRLNDQVALHERNLEAIRWNCRICADGCLARFLLTLRACSSANPHPSAALICPLTGLGRGAGRRPLCHPLSQSGCGKPVAGSSRRFAGGRWPTSSPTHTRCRPRSMKRLPTTGPTPARTSNSNATTA